MEDLDAINLLIVYMLLTSMACCVLLWVYIYLYQSVYTTSLHHNP